MTTDKSTLCWRRYTRSYHLNSIATSRAFSVEFGLGSWIEPKYNMTDYYSNQIEVIYTYVWTALLMNIINALLIKKINIFLYRGTCYKLLKASSVKKGVINSLSLKPSIVCWKRQFKIFYCCAMWSSIIKVLKFVYFHPFLFYWLRYGSRLNYRFISSMIENISYWKPINILYR